MTVKLPTLEEMLEAGMHFGHKTFRWNPKMAPFIFGEREGVHIFDLSITQERLKTALDFVTKIAEGGGKILFVGTKKQAAPIMQKAAEDAGMPYVVFRWPGGMLTNFRTVLKSLKRLDKLESLIQNPYATKKEKRSWQKKGKALEADFAGILDLVELPDALFVVDLLREKTALREAKKLGIPVIGVADSNADPDWAAYPIPANDDATSSIAMIADLVVAAIQAGRQHASQVKAKAEKGGDEKIVVAEEELLAEPEVLKAEKVLEQVATEEEKGKHIKK